jgi:hypothetical protein
MKGLTLRRLKPQENGGNLVWPSEKRSIIRLTNLRVENMEIST